MTNTPPTDVLGQDVATAPGDLPITLVVERARARRRQFRHDNTIDPIGPGPGEPVRVIATSGEVLQVAMARVFYTLDGSAPTETSAFADMSRLSEEWDVLSGYVSVWCAEIPPQGSGTVVRYRIGAWLQPDRDCSEPDLWAQDGQGFWFRFEPELGITTFAYHVEQASQAPEWVRDGVIYQIFLDRFRTGKPDDRFKDTGHKGFHGGTLEGVRRSLPYLVDLGATCLWFSPLHPAETYHRYDGMDFAEVDPTLGSRESLTRLTAEGREHNMRFLMDFVPSHLSWRHPAFLAAQRDSSAPSASWFTFYHHPDKYRTFLDLAPFLPSIRTDDPGARAHIIESAVGWLRDCGIDGFRLDHAIGPSMDFWVALRVAMQQAKAGSFTVGEATDTPDSLRRFRHRLDAILDFPLARALRATFGLRSWDLGQLDGFLNSYERFMATGPFRVSFLDNHDMDRFLFIAGNDKDRLKLAALCQFALEPTPTIYYGTEIGLVQERASSERSFGGDAQVRGDMIWDSARWDASLLDFYRGLITTRKRQPALRSGTRRTVHLDVDSQTYAFVREGDSNEAPSVIAAFNAAGLPRTIELHDLGPGGIELLLSTKGAGCVRRGPILRVELDPNSGALLGTPDGRPAPI